MKLQSLNDPFAEDPQPDLSEALPCTCGREPDWDTDGHRYKLFCWARCVEGPWRRDIDKAIEAWNEAVLDRLRCDLRVVTSAPASQQPSRDS